MCKAKYLPAILLPSWLALGCAKPVAEMPPRPVKVVRVGDTSDLGKRWFPGRARATQEVNLSFQVSGPLIAFPVKVGDKVKKGQLLARIDPQDFEVKLLSAESSRKQSEANYKAMKTGARPEEIAQLEAGLRKADADYKAARIEYEREERLYRQKVLSAAELNRSTRRMESARAARDQAVEALRIGKEGARKEDLEAKESEIESLKAAVKDARNKLEYTYLRAPFDGEIASTFVENYQTVQAKEAIVRLLDTTHIEMTVDVPESLIHLVPQVKSAVVRFNAIPKREFPAAIKEVGSEATRATGTYPVTLILKQPDDKHIKPGMVGEARAGETTEAAKIQANLLVPLAAVFAGKEGGKDSFVWVFDPQSKTVSRRQVTTGEVSTLGVQVTAGLKAGELVVAAGVHHLEEGQRVEAAK
jgi:RND family efflux transporter MFP subunit